MALLVAEESPFELDDVWLNERLSLFELLFAFLKALEDLEANLVTASKAFWRDGLSLPPIIILVLKFFIYHLYYFDLFLASNSSAKSK